jgi:hypothetical protein
MPGNRPWTPEDDLKLRTLLERGMSATLIAAKLKRTKLAIKKRATLIGAHRGQTGFGQARNVPAA